jgi:hypothetical protein
MLLILSYKVYIHLVHEDVDVKCWVWRTCRQTVLKHVGFEVLTAVSMKIAVFWVGIKTRFPVAGVSEAN